MKTSVAYFLITALLLSSACSVETIVHRLDEKEANSIVVLLDENGIVATKAALDTGREVFYHIAVPANERLRAMRILESNNYPRRAIQGYAEVFSESGLIPTSAEEKAKNLRAIEGEIERQIRLVAGVLDVEVNVVIPEESPLRTAEDATSPPKASVAIKYLGGTQDVKPITVVSVQDIVAAAVEKLTPDHVAVMMTRGDARTSDIGACPICPTIATGEAPIVAPVPTGFLGRLSAKMQIVVAAGGAGLVLILCLLLVYGQVSLRNVRARLLHLQSEIANAQRKGRESLPAPVE